MSKEYKPMTKQDITWRDKTFSKKEQNICIEIWGGIPMYDELFVRNNTEFKIKQK